MREDIRTLTSVKELNERVIDVMVWGASRPSLFRQTIESFRDNAQFRTGRLRFFLEDGLFDKTGALESVIIAKSHGFDGIHVEHVGSYGWAMTQAMNRWVRAPLMFSLEDDWLSLRTIDFDHCFDCFIQNAHVNQIRYNRQKNTASQNEGAVVFVRRELPINGVMYPFMSSAHWYFNPAAWRMSYVRPRWRGVHRNVHFYMNSSSGFLPPGTSGRPPMDWYADVLGALTWGDVGERAFFKHIGAGHSVHKARGFV